MFKECDVTDLKDKKPFLKINKLDSDQSGEKEYKLNSLGFRGEEFNKKTKFKLFIAGCSNTFGTGLNWEETWGYQFKKIFCKKYNYNLNKVNLMNFGIIGQSNDFIVRNVLIQMSYVKPDLLIIFFTYTNRTEYLIEDQIERIGPWDLESKIQHAIDYYVYYTHEIGFANLMRNILLVQNYCKLNKIKYIFNLINYEDLYNGVFSYNSACLSLVQLVDKKYICDFTLEKLDLAADGAHYGYKSHKLFAEKLFKFYEERRYKK